MAQTPYAELHCHTNFSFLDGASSPDDLVERAVALGLTGLAVTDHNGLYGAVRFVSAAEAAGLHPVVGLEIELLDPAVPDPDELVIPARRPRRRGGRLAPDALAPSVTEGLPRRPRPSRARLPGHREPVKEDLRGIGEGSRGPHLVLLARSQVGWRSLCRLVSRANMAGTKAAPRFSQALLAEHTEGLVALSGCRDGELARRLRAGDRAGARAAAQRHATLFGRGDGAATSGFFVELSHHLLPDDDWLVSESAALAEELGLPVVVANDVHYAKPEDRELADVLAAIRHGRSLETLGDLRRPDGESSLKSGSDMMVLPPGGAAFGAADPRAARAWTAGISTAAEVAASCSVDLGFEQYRFPGFPVPGGETAFSYLVELCQAGARKRYHPLTPPVVKRLAHELDVIERAGLAEFFLICWDLMRFAREQGIPAQGRGSATSSIVSYTLGISRVEPISHDLLFERFINPGRTTYPDVDIDFSSERREEVIQYIYRRYGPEHTGMVCNLVTYRARSAVREVGYALGFPRPLVDRVAKALETYDSVMVRRDLEADGGFAEFFRRPSEGTPAEESLRTHAVETAEALGLVDGMGQLNTRIPLVGKVPPWRQPREPEDPNAPRPFAWLREDGPTGPTAEQGSAGQGAAEQGSAGQGAAEQGSAGQGAAEPARAGQGGEPSRSGMWEGAPESPPSIRPGGRHDDEGGPGDTPASVAWLRAGRGTGYAADREWLVVPAPADGGAATGRDAADGDAATGRDAADGDAVTGRPADGDAAAAAWKHPAGLTSGILPPPADRGFASSQAGLDGAIPDRDGPFHVGRLSAGPGRRGSEAAWGPARPDSAAGSRIESANDDPRAVGSPRDDPLAPRTPIRGSARTDDEGGPGDTPASVAWLRAGRGRGDQADVDRLWVENDGSATGPPRSEAELRDAIGPRIRRIDPESGQLEPPPRTTDRRHDDGGRATDPSPAADPGRATDKLGRPTRWDPPAPRRADTGAAAAHSSVARVEPEPPPQPRGGSTVGLSDWERWLEFCARIDGFPRHLSIHSGGMLVTAAPLIDIAPIERATMVDRVVVQFDKRDVETLKLIKLDLLGLGMLAAMDETLQLIEHDCAVCLDLDRLPEDVPEVFAMLQAADTVGVFQVESRAQMQTLPKSRPRSLDDLVVEVAIIRPGPIQGNAVHPFLRRKQGLEPVTYLHPSLEPVLKDSMGVILYQEQVMRIAIEVAGFTAAESDGFRRAMGTWRSSREMEKLHRQFFEGCLRQPGMTEETAEELFRQVAAFASFGFAKSHAAAFARTAYESAFLKLFYPAQFLVGLINAQPMGFYPVEVLVNDAKRHGVSVMPVDLNASSYKTTTEWVGRPGEPLPPGAGIDARPEPIQSSACIVPSAEAQDRWTPEVTTGWGVRLGLHLVKGIGEQHQAALDRELAAGPYRTLAEVVDRTGLPEEVIERLIRTGALDSFGCRRRELLWQLREVAGASRGRVDGRALRGLGRAAGKRSAAAGRPMDLRLPATEAPSLPPLTESERIGDTYAVIGLDARRQVVGLFRPVLDRLGAVTNGALASMPSGRVRLGGLVVTRQHPMTAKGTVFLALEDETGMVNVTLWPDTWARLRGVVRRHALLLVDGDLQREGAVVNVIAHMVRPLPEVAAEAGGPDRPSGVRQLGHAGMRRLG